MNTWAIDRWEREQIYPGPRAGTGPRLVKSDDVYLRVVPEYDALTYRLRRTTDNKTELQAEAAYRLASADLEYQAANPLEVVYRGLRPISPDGAIQSVSWSVSDEHPGAQTRASRNDEFTVVGLDYKDRRRLERIGRQEMAKLTEQAKKLKLLSDKAAAGAKFVRGVFGR